MRPLPLATLLITAALASCSADEQAPAYPTARLVHVVVAARKPFVQGGAITGEIRARVQTDLSFRVSGKVVERLADVGDHVSTGQLLARIDAEEQKAELEVARANLQAAEAQQTQAQLAFNRQQNLFKAQVTTRASLDQAQEALLTAQGSLKSAQAQVATALDALSYTDLKAAADGVITARNAEVGQVAQAAQAIFTLAHDGPRDAVFEVVESLFIASPVDPSARVSLLSDPLRSVQAQIREISPTIDSSTGTVKVKAAIDSGVIMPLGAPVSGAFQYKPRDVVQLPWSAMASKNGHPAVWVVDPKTSEVALRSIKAGAYETGRFVAEAGVAEGEIVVSEGVKFLRPSELVSYDKEAAK